MSRWTYNCDAQLLLDDLFKTNEILPTNSPSDIQNKYDIFKKFSNSVFRKHYYLTKQKYSSGCNNLFYILYNLHLLTFLLLYS